MKKEFGGDYRLSGPRGPVIGQLVVKLGGVDRKIDVLRNVVGLSHKELSADAVELEFGQPKRRFRILENIASRPFKAVGKFRKLYESFRCLSLILQGSQRSK